LRLSCRYQLTCPTQLLDVSTSPSPSLRRRGRCGLGNLTGTGTAGRGASPAPGQKKQKPRGGSPRGASWIDYVARISASRANVRPLLLEVHPELDVAPLLIGAGTQVLFDVRTGKHVPIGSLESQLAIHHHVGPAEVQFISDVLLGIACP